MPLTPTRDDVILIAVTMAATFVRHEIRSVSHDITITLTGTTASLAARPSAQSTVETVLTRLDDEASRFPRVTLGPGTLVYAAADAIGLVAEGLALTFRGLGHDVELRVLGPWLLRHGCGAAYDPQEWFARPHAHVELVGAKPRRHVGYVEVRVCDCGAEISLAAMVLVRTSTVSAVIPKNEVPK